MSDEPTVLAAREGALAHVTLNRPRAINALTLEMIRALHAALDAAAADDDVRLVLLDGAGERGFCAGGDIVALRDAAVSGDHAPAEAFWTEEYALNRRIARFAKPVVAVMDGIVMGGGIGLAGHASHRVATERLLTAMPEVGIGFAPDVGGTWLLSHAPGELGTHLALSGARIGAADALEAGLADGVVAADRLPALYDALRDGDADAALGGAFAWPGDDGASGGDPPGGGPTLADAREWIDVAYAGDDAVAILARLGALGHEAGERAARAVAAASPTSVTVALAALRRAAQLPDLEAALAMELGVSRQFLAEPDFAEGIRAAVVDKDRSPAWSPADLGSVGDVERFFTTREAAR